MKMNEKGSIIVFFTLTIVVLLSIIGIGLDTGYLTFSRKIGQRAVDMAALSAAQALAQGDVIGIKNNIESLKNDYVKDSINPINGSVDATSGTGKNVTLLRYDSGILENTPVPLNHANAIRVALESASAIKTPAFLTPLLNLLGGHADATNDINVSAVAIATAVPSLPIALGDSKCHVGLKQKFYLTTSSDKGKTTNNAAWTTYLDNSVSTSDIKELVQKVTSCQETRPIHAGTDINLTNGAKIPDIKEINTVIGKNSDGTQKCYLAPVIAQSNIFNQSTPIITFASICPTSVNTTGPDGKYIEADVKSCDVKDLHEPEISQCYLTKLIE